LHKRLWLLATLAIVAVAVVAAACGGGKGESSATPTPATTPTPAAGAMEIDVAAQGIAFDKTTLEAKASQPFAIRLDNKDSVTHNLHIFTKKGGDSIAVTDPDAVQGGKTGTLTTTIAQPGDYYFQCDFHPGQMNGTLTVK